MTEIHGIEFEEQPNAAAAATKKPPKARTREEARDQELVRRTRAVRDQSSEGAGGGAPEAVAPPAPPVVPPPALDPVLASLTRPQRQLVGDLVLAAWPYQRERAGPEQLVQSAVALVRHLSRIGLMGQKE